MKEVAGISCLGLDCTLAGLGWPPNAGIPLRSPRHKLSGSVTETLYEKRMQVGGYHSDLEHGAAVGQPSFPLGRAVSSPRKLCRANREWRACNPLGRVHPSRDCTVSFEGCIQYPTLWVGRAATRNLNQGLDNYSIRDAKPKSHGRRSTQSNPEGTRIIDRTRRRPLQGNALIPKSDQRGLSLSHSSEIRRKRARCFKESASQFQCAIRTSAQVNRFGRRFASGKITQTKHLAKVSPNFLSTKLDTSFSGESCVFLIRFYILKIPITSVPANTQRQSGTEEVSYQ